MDVQVTVDAEHLPTLGAAVYLRMYVWSDTLYKGRVHTNVCTYERARSQKYLESVYHSAKISSTHKYISLGKFGLPNERYRLD